MKRPQEKRSSRVIAILMLALLPMMSLGCAALVGGAAGAGAGYVAGHEAGEDEAREEIAAERARDDD
jgi:hypothetical protein